MDWARLKARATRQHPAEMFIADLREHWAKHGADILERIKTENPKLYRKLMKEGELK